MDKKELEKMSGENEMGKAPKLELNQIRLQGAKGVFIYEYVKEGLIEVDGKKQYRKEEIGNQISVVFLKIRRKLVQFRKGQKSLMTSEHNAPSQKVVLFGDKIEKGVASELRELHPQLRTQQIVYALYKGELVKIIIKGASLGSDSKPKEVYDFYSYISSFKDKSKDDHFYEFFTELETGKEDGQLGSYYVMHFTQGKKLTETQMEKVGTNMKIAFDFCENSDKYYMRYFSTTDPIVEELRDDIIDITEYPEDESTGEIPF